MNVLNYNFNGPYILGTPLDSTSGIYLVYNQNQWLDVGETGNVGQRINNNAHERQVSWILNSNNLQIFILFLPVQNQQSRLNLESYFRSMLRPVCGER